MRSTSLFESTSQHPPTAWRSELFPGWGAVVRSHMGTPFENLLVFTMGPLHTHYDGNCGGTVFWGRGFPLTDEFGYSSGVGRSIKGHAVFDVGQSGQPSGGCQGRVERVVRSGNVADYVTSLAASRSRRFVHVMSDEPSGANYFVIIDDVASAGGNGNRWRWVGSDKSKFVQTSVTESQWSTTIRPEQRYFAGSVARIMVPLSVSGDVTARFYNESVEAWNDLGSKFARVTRTLPMFELAGKTAPLRRLIAVVFPHDSALSQLPVTRVVSQSPLGSCVLVSHVDGADVVCASFAAGISWNSTFEVDLMGNGVLLPFSHAGTASLVRWRSNQGLKIDLAPLCSHCRVSIGSAVGCGPGAPLAAAAGPLNGTDELALTIPSISAVLADSADLPPACTPIAAAAGELTSVLSLTRLNNNASIPVASALFTANGVPWLETRDDEFFVSPGLSSEIPFEVVVRVLEFEQIGVSSPERLLVGSNKGRAELQIRGEGDVLPALCSVRFDVGRGRIDMYARKLGGEKGGAVSGVISAGLPIELRLRYSNGTCEALASHRSGCSDPLVVSTKRGMTGLQSAPLLRAALGSRQGRARWGLSGGEVFQIETFPRPAHAPADYMKEEPIGDCGGGGVTTFFVLLLLVLVGILVFLAVARYLGKWDSLVVNNVRRLCACCPCVSRIPQPQRTTVSSRSSRANRGFNGKRDSYSTELS